VTAEGDGIGFCLGPGGAWNEGVEAAAAQVNGSGEGDIVIADHGSGGCGGAAANQTVISEGVGESHHPEVVVGSVEVHSTAVSTSYLIPPRDNRSVTAQSSKGV